MIHVHLFLVDHQNARVVQASDCISVEERRRAAAFLFERDRRHYCAAHGILRGLLSEYLGIPALEVVLGVADKGKPYVANPGCDRLRFNLSHSGRFVALAFGLGREVGIDVESLVPLDAADQVTRSQFCACEIAEYESLPEEDRAEAFCAGWTRKEAFLKATGQGLHRSLDSFVVPLTPRTVTTVLPSVEAASVPWTLVDLPVRLPGCRAAVVYEGTDADVRIFQSTEMRF